MSNFFLTCILAIVAITSCYCVSAQQYRQIYHPVDAVRLQELCESRSQLLDSQKEEVGDIGRHVFLDYDPNVPISIDEPNLSGKHWMGIVEFDDHGKFWNKLQMVKLIERLSQIPPEKGAIVVVFIHGWKHNASPCDKNLIEFQNSLKLISQGEAVSSIEQNRMSREVVGVYVGWRGLNVKMPLLKQTTFYNRKNAARRVGDGAVPELLLNLRNAVYKFNDSKKSKQSRLVLVGHSFGGKVLYSSMSSHLTEDIIQSRDPNHRPFADLTVLINPAFDATRMDALHVLTAMDGVNQITWPENQRPVLSVFTSRGDNATKNFFPLGRFFSANIEGYRDSNQRAASICTVGHLRRYRTHYLDPFNEVPMPVRLETYAGWLDERRQPGGFQQVAGLKLTHYQYSPFNPFQVVYVDKSIIPDHTKIFEKNFVEFLALYIARNVDLDTRFPALINGEPLVL